MKYVLIKKTDGQIKIIDNNTGLGKRRVEKEIMDGGEHIGSMESELRPMQIERGFNVYASKRTRDLQKQLNKIWNVLQE